MRQLPLIFMLGALALGCSSNDDVPSPIVSAVTPNVATPGTVVVVTGSYFCQQPQGTGDDDDDTDCTATGTVSFGAAPATPSDWTDTSISVEVPEGIAGSVDVSVTAAGKTSNSVSFTAE